MSRSQEGEPGAYSSEAKIDQEVAREICSRREFDGQRFERGQFVAILGGRIVAVGASFDEAEQALLTRVPDRRRGLICEVEDPVVDVIRRPG